MSSILMAISEGRNRFDKIVPLSQEEKAIRDAKDLNAENGTLNASDGYDCVKCRNKGFVYYADGKKVSAYRCDCWKARRSVKRMQESGLGRVIHKYTFELWKTTEEWQKKVKETAEQFCADEGASWFFIGGCSGAGKSHICTAICRNFLSSREVHYMMWEEEGPELKSIVNDAEAYQARMNRLKNVDVLYIDDFFSGKKERNGEAIQPTAADVRLAREILNHRYVNGKTTIISSEWYSMEVFEIDNAIGGRVVEMCGPYCLNIKRGAEKNYRLKMGGVMV